MAAMGPCACGAAAATRAGLGLAAAFPPCPLAAPHAAVVLAAEAAGRFGGDGAPKLEPPALCPRARGRLGPSVPPRSRAPLRVERWLLAKARHLSRWLLMPCAVATVLLQTGQATPPAAAWARPGVARVVGMAWGVGLGRRLPLLPLPCALPVPGGVCCAAETARWAGGAGAGSRQEERSHVRTDARTLCVAPAGPSMTVAPLGVRCSTTPHRPTYFPRSTRTPAGSGVCACVCVCVAEGVDVGGAWPEPRFQASHRCVTRTHRSHRCARPRASSSGAAAAAWQK